MESDQAVSPEDQLAQIEQIERETFFPPSPAPEDVPPLSRRILGGALVIVITVGLLATWLWLQVRTDSAWWVLLGGLVVVFGSMAALRLAIARSTGMKPPLVLSRKVYKSQFVEFLPTAIGCGLFGVAINTGVDRSVGFWGFVAIGVVYFAIAIPAQILWTKRRRAQSTT